MKLVSISAIIWNIGILILTGVTFYFTRSWFAFLLLLFHVSLEFKSEGKEKGVKDNEENEI